MSVGLPIDAVIDDLKRALQEQTHAVLVAPPGAGKSTRVPLTLLHEPWLAGRKLVMLEPRRLAARSVASYMARQLGETVGETVGYRVRQDTRVGPRTRIEVVTEGVLTRMLQHDPSLEDVGAVLFDEFHERSIHADMGLALCLQMKAWFREDLRLLVMSATLDAEPTAALLGDAPVVRSEGRVFPVETVYAEQRAGHEGERLEKRVADAAVLALTRYEGDVLVFLPGAPEIRRTSSQLGERLRGQAVRIAPLYGTLSVGEQDRAIAPSVPGERKIVLATSIAETSLTVEGVRVVIDSGLARVPRFSPRTGMTRLETVRVSKASAEQRRGRAGRTANGVCLRLWTEEEHRALPERSTPEIAEADLAPLALELAAWGIVEPAELRWLDPPPAAAYRQARELLRELGALDEACALTEAGRRMAELGLHPRLARLLLASRELGLAETACRLAALLGERDVLRGNPGGRNADLRLRLQELARPHTADEAAIARIRIEADRFMRDLQPTEAQQPRLGAIPDDAAPGLLLAYAYPDRIALRREGAGRFLLSGGRGAVLEDGQPLAYEPMLVVAEAEDAGVDSRILLAAPLAPEWFERVFSPLFQKRRITYWDRAAQAVRSREQVSFGALVLKDAHAQSAPAEEILRALLEGIKEEGLDILPWSKQAEQLRDRLRFAGLHIPGYPDATDVGLLGALPEWLGTFADGMRSRSDLRRIPLMAALEGLLSWEQRRELDRLAPTHLVVPSGSRIPVDYSDPEAPVLAVRLQELFGLAATPAVAGGSVPLTLHLLSPAHRPVQVTRDLVSFWKHTYFDVKKDLKGRYPKHYWPDDPWNAVPTNRVRPKL